MAQEELMRASIVTLSIAFAGCSSSPKGPGPAWLFDAHVQTVGVGVTNTDCTTAICQHNENTDMISYRNMLWLVHRTARSQILGPNSSLHIFRSKDNGKSFDEVSIIVAPSDRDLRDPHFYIVGDELYLEALTRLPVTSPRDTGVDTVAIGFHSSDGINWVQLNAIGPVTWSFWRPQLFGGVYYSAAYHDGDTSVALFSSTDGVNWTRGADVWANAADTTVETELLFQPSGALLALVRMDGTDAELLGDTGRLRTNVCVAQPPYSSFTCPMVLDGVRLDGPLGFTWNGRTFMVARKHLQPSDRKRTALYELTGDLSSGNIAIMEWGELPSAGDTSYAGQVALDDHRVMVSWYSSDIPSDENWSVGLIDASDIWLGIIDFSKLK
jgi:hypothetical protein